MPILNVIITPQKLLVMLTELEAVGFSGLSILTLHGWKAVMGLNRSPLSRRRNNGMALDSQRDSHCIIPHCLGHWHLAGPQPAVLPAAERPTNQKEVVVMKQKEFDRLMSGEWLTGLKQNQNSDSEGNLILADIAVSLERIADALETALQVDSQYLPAHFRTRSL